MSLKTASSLRWVIRIACLFTVLLAPCAVLAQATRPGAAVQDPLAARQQIVRDRLAQLEDRMFRLAEKLGKAEPQQAHRLEQALRQSGELLIRNHMDQAIQLLEQADLAQAADHQAAAEKALDQLLKLLTESGDDPRQHQEELDRMRDLRQRVDELLDRQLQLRSRTDPAEHMESLKKPLEPLQKPKPSDEALNSKDAAKQQQDLQSSAGKLADSMEGSAQPEPKDGKQAGSQPSGSSKNGRQNEPGEQPESGQAQKPSQPPEPSPGAGSVRKAEQHMKSAADKLDKDKPSDATKDQDKAIQQLEQAKADLQEALDQMRREQQEEMLASLEQRFRAMLLEQKGINASTEDLDKRKAAWTRNDSLGLAGLSEKQKTLSGEAGKAIEILTADGTSVVFPEILVQVRDDMIDVSKRLAGQQTGAVTREIQAGILSALQELVDAVEQRRKDGPPPPQQAGGGGGGDQDQSALLPGSAELKLLRSCQVRINRQTRQIQATATQPAADVGDQSKRLSVRQEQLADMARKINERAGGH